MKKTLLSIALGLVLSTIPALAIYAACPPEVEGCKLVGTSKSCDANGCVEICAYNCGPAPSETPKGIGDL